MENKESKDRNLPNENAVLNNKMNDARKKGLTRGALTTAIISAIILLALGVLFYSLYKKEHTNQLALMQDQKKSFTEQLTARDSMINEWLLAFDEIEKDLITIKQKENLITMKSSDSELTKARKDQILADIQSINTLLDANKKKIASLSAQLKESGGTIKGLQVRIAALEDSVKQYEVEIADLKNTLVKKDFEIGQLNTRVFALQDTITIKDETINTQAGKLNQAFLVYGTFKDLKEMGLVSKEGGFLGLGRKEILIEDFSDSLFQEINITITRTIPVNSKNVKLITEHPSASYELIPEGDNKIAYIEIKNPELFWKISKYAVVELIK
jgi:chromosome segregation ATPase